MPDEQTWNRLIRFEAADGQTLMGEPVDASLDIGLAIAQGQQVEAYVLNGEHPWSQAATRTGEVATVRKVSPISWVS